MIPAHVVELDSWPVNANGKIDRAAVRRQVEEHVSPDVVGGTRSGVMKNCSEHEIRDAVRRLISERVDEVSLDDSASLIERTSLDSMGVVELLVAIEEEFSISVDFMMIDVESLLSISGLTHHVSMLMGESDGG
jgi:acyl carrier protein